ncbi:SHOCT domain-containing protein [Amycolatopsis panacis]|uniref:SHOCT domain-containing protein n=1 Tax=Amycolatopsis panacis TaxID=2340917 RepID=A0A419I714_9PSEU|nr:SHOCT domain-containing protein [Amycolatopsis panacis]RJQ87243.1 SHOCT domain-containing protein [Amycolatopsis panacis]
MPYWHYGTDASWVGPVVMIVGLVLLVAAIGIVVAFLARRPVGGPGPGSGSGSGSGSDDAIAILRQRFARGEIDQEEYDRRREALLR